jgi:hypothetical protein
VDQRADAGDHQRQRGRELVPAQVDRDPQVAGQEPVVAAQDRGARGRVPAEQLEEGGDRDPERGGQKQRGQPAGQPAEAPPEERVDGEAGQRQQRQQPDQTDRAGSVQDPVTP